jgi:hypothetical protein
MDQARTDDQRPGDAERPCESGAAAPGRGGRMSRQRKMAAVLRLLRGEDLETVSRSLGVTPSSPPVRRRWRRSRHRERSWRAIA